MKRSAAATIAAIIILAAIGISVGWHSMMPQELDSSVNNALKLATGVHMSSD